jgi:hypothetical protein
MEKAHQYMQRNEHHTNETSYFGVEEFSTLDALS